MDNFLFLDLNVLSEDSYANGHTITSLVTGGDYLVTNVV